MAQKLKKKNTTVKKVIKKAKTPTRAGAKQMVVESQTFSIPTGEYVEGIGRRKVATSRVRVYMKPGDFVVNNMVVGEYFRAVLNAPTLYNRPFIATDTLGQFAVTAKVSGSGIAAQLDAVVHGLSRALVKMNPDLKPLLKAEGLLTRDDRMKETRKIGTGGKARRKRQSPKR